MSIPRFFERVHAAVGRHLVVEREALSELLDAVVVGVECAEPADLAASWTGELLVNQLARLYPRLCIFGDATTAARFRALARSINPLVEFDDRPEAATATVSLVTDAHAGSLVVGSSGWSTFVGSAIPEPRVSCPNVFAAAAAAAFAAAAIFRRAVLGQSEAFEPFQYNLLSTVGVDNALGSLGPVDLGRVLLAGVGAVGNAAIWCLARVPQLRGKVWVIDPDAVELSNLQRYVLTTDADVGMDKTALAYRALRETGLRLHELRGRLGQSTVPADIEHVLVTVDNPNGRRVAQAVLPLLVVNGWTSESGLGASWHDFRAGAACLSCLYHPHGKALSQTEIVSKAIGLPHERVVATWVSGALPNADDIAAIAEHLQSPAANLNAWIGKRLQDLYTTVVCGAGAVPLRPEHRPEVVPLAHQSVLAGVLAAAELVKRLDPMLAARAPNENLVAWHDVTRSPPSHWLQQRSQEPGCICSDDDYRDVHHAKWGQRVEPTREGGPISDVSEVTQLPPVSS